MHAEISQVPVRFHGVALTLRTCNTEMFPGTSQENVHNFSVK
jgi:hypothetical protein